jgi:hypothetical protein
MRGWKIFLLGLVVVPLAVCAADSAASAPDAGTNTTAASTNSGLYRDKVAREHFEKELNQSKQFHLDADGNLPSLRPALAPPRMSAGQLEKIKILLDERRNWMLADPHADPSTNSGAAAEEQKLARKTFGVGEATASEKYLERETSQRAAASSNAAFAEADSRAELSEKTSFTKTLFGLDNAAERGTSGESAMSSIARLFQNSASGNERMNYSANAARVVAPLADSLGAQHQLGSLTRSYETPVVAVRSFAPAPAPVSSLSGVSALSGIAAPPTVSTGVRMPGFALPAPVAVAPVQFTPVLPPTRRF